MYIFTNTGAISIRENDRDNLVISSNTVEPLEEIISSLELSGNAEDEYSVGVSYTVNDIVPSQSKNYIKPLIAEFTVSTTITAYELVLSKATFAVYMQFEILNFLDYGGDEYFWQSAKETTNENYAKLLTTIKGLTDHVQKK